MLIAKVAYRLHAFLAWVAPRASWRPALCVAFLWLACLPTLRAQGIDLVELEAVRSEEGLMLNYQANFELPRAVEEALLKGVPLYFEAEARLVRPRWYWFDKRVTRVTRGWRLTWQPLTRNYRVTQGILSQSYDTLGDALGAVQRGRRWKLADPGEVDDDGRQYVEFAFRLDTSQLPRPLQISFGGEADWALSIERRTAVPEAAPR